VKSYLQNAQLFVG